MRVHRFHPPGSCRQQIKEGFRGVKVRGAGSSGIYPSQQSPELPCKQGGAIAAVCRKKSGNGFLTGKFLSFKKKPLRNISGYE
jgi:hypothetical protein